MKIIDKRIITILNITLRKFMNHPQIQEIFLSIMGKSIFQGGQNRLKKVYIPIRKSKKF